MTTAKLTQAQVTFLRAVVAGNAYRSEGHDLYKTYVIGERRPIRDTVIRALLDAGLVEHSFDRHPHVGGVTSTWVATDAGRGHPAAADVARTESE